MSANDISRVHYFDQQFLRPFEMRMDVPEDVLLFVWRGDGKAGAEPAFVKENAGDRCGRRECADG